MAPQPDWPGQQVEDGAPGGALSHLPPAHAQRQALNDEVHARPPEPLAVPLRLSYLVLLADEAGREAAWQAVRALAAQYGTAAPERENGLFSADLGPFRLRWERHVEFYRVQFTVPFPASSSGTPPPAPNASDAFATPAADVVPTEWVSTLPGQLLVAVHAALLAAPEAPGAALDAPFPDPAGIAAQAFGGNQLVGAGLLEGRGAAFTDFRIHADGFSRLLVLNRDMTEWQAGRAVQRLLEVETYRMLALLAFPVARSLAPFLRERERELAAVAAVQTGAGEKDEPVLLERLTRLAAEIEGREADHLYRFGAAAAYYDLVQRRIEELREVRIEGLTTFREFMERRLAPAMGTCGAVSARQDALSRRVARATQLLATRVELTRERQAYAVLASMNRRFNLQLRLQQTVEGLSVAAITYYVAGLVSLAAKGVGAAGFKVSADLVTAAALPVVALLVALGLRRARRIAAREKG